MARARARRCVVGDRPVDRMARGGAERSVEDTGRSGYSTVAVVGGRAFTMFASGDAEFAVCLDVTSGKEIWRAGLGELLVDNDGADGPRATPTVDDDRVYVVSAMGRLYALDVATGVEHWHVDLR